MYLGVRILIYLDVNYRTNKSKVSNNTTISFILTLFPKKNLLGEEELYMAFQAMVIVRNFYCNRFFFSITDIFFNNLFYLKNG